MLLGIFSIAVTLTSDFVYLSSKVLLDIQATIECGFIVKSVCDITARYTQIYRTEKN